MAGRLTLPDSKPRENVTCASINQVRSQRVSTFFFNCTFVITCALPPSLLPCYGVGAAVDFVDLSPFARIFVKDEHRVVEVRSVGWFWLVIRNSCVRAAATWWFICSILIIACKMHDILFIFVPAKAPSTLVVRFIWSFSTRAGQVPQVVSMSGKIASVIATMAVRPQSAALKVTAYQSQRWKIVKNHLLRF